MARRYSLRLPLAISSPVNDQIISFCLSLFLCTCEDSQKETVIGQSSTASCLTARSQRFGGWFRSRRARGIARRLARVSLRRSVRFETGPVYCPTARSRRFGRWLDRDGPGGMPDGLRAELRNICASTDGSIETGPAYCLMARSRHFGRWFKMGSVSCPMARLRCFGGWLDPDGPGGLPDGPLVSLRWMVGSRGARRPARRLSRIALAYLHFCGWFDSCPAACQTACVYHFGSRWARWLAQRLARVASADQRFGGSLKAGTEYLPHDSSWLRVASGVRAHQSCHGES